MQPQSRRRRSPNDSAPGGAVVAHPEMERNSAGELRLPTKPSSFVVELTWGPPYCAAARRLVRTPWHGTAFSRSPMHYRGNGTSRMAMR